MDTRLLSELKPHPLNAEIYGDGCDADLRDSVKAKGILTPVLITSPQAEIGGNVIISGHRRFNAAQMAQLMNIPVTVSGILTKEDIEEAVIIANKQRQKTNEQVGREYQKLIGMEEAKAKARQAENALRNQPQSQKVEPVPPSEIVHQPTVKTSVTRMPTTGGKSRDVVGAKIGMSGKHAERAARVVEVIDTLRDSGETEQAKEMQETLNRSVKAAYKQAKEIEQEQQSQRETLQLITQPGIVANKSTFNATNDNIEWAKWSWNPVTGCEHGCQYCYARDIAMRFTGHFHPEFHKDRLNAPFHTKVPALRKDEPGITNVFVCSMADLFGEWVPDEWIQQVLTEVEHAPHWNFLFLTKSPERYLDQRIVFPQNCWVGATADTQERMTNAIDVFAQLEEEGRKPRVTFVSCEPLSEFILMEGETDPVGWNADETEREYAPDLRLSALDWVIIGGRSKSSGMEAGQPEWMWVESLLFEARKYDIKVYFKPNLTVLPKEYPS